MHQPIDPVWEERSDQLDFRFGAHVLWRVPLRVLSLQSNPLVVSPDVAVPLDEALSQGYRAVVKYATPVAQSFPAIHIDRRALRYAARYGERYIVDIDGSFEGYQQKFSSKSRNTLKRKVKKIVQMNDQQNPLQVYKTLAEMKKFREIAISISHRSYKRELGWGFREDEGFAQQLETDADRGGVRGYVLNLGGEPAAYVFCRVDHDVIIYKHLGHDDRFTQHSPGTVLLYLMLEQLFVEGEFRLLDFDGMEHIPYKEFFSTRMLRCARVVWFRPTVRNIALVTGHWLVTAAWRIATAHRDSARRYQRQWGSVRRLSPRWRRLSPADRN